jgi:AcrR family transcriptional regulator
MTNMPKPPTKSAARHEMVLGQLMEAAERLFAQQGVAGTSLNELAEAVGLTRTGIYHYIKGKDEMLETLVRGFTVETAEDLRRLAEARDQPAYDRLREGVTNMAERVAQHPQRFRLLLTTEGAFPPGLARQYLQARRETLSALTDLVSQAITDGSCRPVDPELAAFTLAGASNWVAFWYPRKSGAGHQSPRDLAEGLADLALEGLRDTRVSANGDGITHVLGLLKDDVNRLEHMIHNA